MHDSPFLHHFAEPPSAPLAASALLPCTSRPLLFSMVLLCFRFLTAAEIIADDAPPAGGGTGEGHRHARPVCRVALAQCSQRDSGTAVSETAAAE